MSRTYLASHDIDNAMNLMKKGLESAEERNEKVMEGIIKIWLAEIMVKANAFREYEIEKMAEEGIQILEKLQAKSWYTLGYLVMGEFFTELSPERKSIGIPPKSRRHVQEDEDGLYYLAKTQEVLKRL